MYDIVIHRQTVNHSLDFSLKYSVEDYLLTKHK